MLADGGAGLVLTTAALVAGGVAGYASVSAQSRSRHHSRIPDTGAGADNLAYVIHTSGSTGKPKGAGNTHGALLNRLAWMQRAYGLTAADRVLQKTPVSFDVSVWEFFWPLLTGAVLVMAPPGAHRDPAALAGVIREHGVTTVHFVPSMLRAFLDSGALGGCVVLRRVLCSGEALAADAVAAFRAQHGAELHNLYGPTEAAIDVTAWACGAEDEASGVPIGRPIDNLSIRILDAALEPVPQGVAGELYIGGVGLARGYVNRPGLTAERFVPDPFGGAGGRLYRTGDRARWRGDGAIEYLGRSDHQVKIRGLRIELGEIEARLCGHPAVRDAAVVVRGGVLAGYVVADAGAGLEAALRAHLAAGLPEYMVPARIVVLERFPLTANGKLDRGALPEPERPAADHVAPRTETERRLAALWAEVLGCAGIGVTDDFFDLGGHSLLVTRVLSRVRREWGIDIPLKALFDHPSIETLAVLIDDAVSEKAGGLSAQEMGSLLDDLEAL